MELTTTNILVPVLTFLVAAVVVVPLLKLLRASSVLGYLAAGLLVGHHGFGLIDENEVIEFFGELGIVFLLFAIGLELSVERLKVLRRYVFGLGSLQVVITALLICFTAIAFNIDAQAAVVIGGGLALSSTAFVLQLLVERKALNSKHGRVTFSILLLQDLAIVPLLALVPLLEGDSANLASALGIAGLKALVAVTLTILIGRVALRRAFRAIAESGSPELLVAATLLLILGTGQIMELAGVSMALGAFLAGLLISGTEFRHQVEADIRPFSGLFLGLFFMSVGLSIDLVFIWSHLLTILSALVALVLGKTLVITLLGQIFKLPLGLSLRTGLLLAQGGEFCFALTTSATSFGVISDDLRQGVFALVTLSMVLTPFLMRLGVWLEDRLGRSDGGMVSMPTKPEPRMAEEPGHVIISGFGRVGRTVARVMIRANVPYIAFDKNPKLVRYWRERGFAVYFGDSERHDVIETAGLKRARAAVITINDRKAANSVVVALRKVAPELPILVRARDLEHRDELCRAGANDVVPETIEASLQLGGIVLYRVGLGTEEVARLLDGLRDESYMQLISGSDAPEQDNKSRGKVTPVRLEPAEAPSGDET